MGFFGSKSNNRHHRKVQSPESIRNARITAMLTKEYHEAPAGIRLIKKYDININGIDFTTHLYYYEYGDGRARGKVAIGEQVMLFEQDSKGEVLDESCIKLYHGALFYSKLLSQKEMIEMEYIVPAEEAMSQTVINDMGITDAKTTRKYRLDENTTIYEFEAMGYRGYRITGCVCDEYFRINDPHLPGSQFPPIIEWLGSELVPAGSTKNGND